MRVLYIHGVSSFGGSTKSLLEMYLKLKFTEIDATILCPSGVSEKTFKKAGMKTFSTIGLAQFDNTLYGHYRRLRWIILLREMVYIIPTLYSIFKIWLKCKKFDLIHANEITLLPVAICAKLILRCPLAIHVRSVQRGNAKDIRSKVIYFLLNKFADKIIAIDETVKSSLPDFNQIAVVHNSLNLPNSFDASKARQTSIICRIGIVGSLMRLKGIYEFIEATHIIINERNLDANFIIVGENTRQANRLLSILYKYLGFSDDTKRDLYDFIKTHQLQDKVLITGFVDDVREIYNNLDILCFPSHLNAAGRPVFEAAFYSIPSIVAIDNPKPDTIIHNKTGICIKKSCPKSLADAISFLITNKECRLEMGKEAQKLAFKNFDIENNAKKIIEIYNFLSKNYTLQIN